MKKTKTRNLLADMSVWTARDLMTRKVVTVGPEDGVRDAAARLLENDVHGAPVVDRDGKVVGVWSMTDVTRHEREREPIIRRDSDYYRMAREAREKGVPWDRGFHLEEVGEAKVADWMCPFVISVYENASLADVVGILLRNRIHRVVVVRPPGPELVGVISETDLLVALYAAIAPEDAPQED